MPAAVQCDIYLDPAERILCVPYEFSRSIIYKPINYNWDIKYTKISLTYFSKDIIEIS